MKFSYWNTWIKILIFGRFSSQQRWYTYVILIAVYIAYLLVGALLFQYFEEEYEVSRVILKVNPWPICKTNPFQTPNKRSLLNLRITSVTHFYTKDGKCAEAKAALQRKLEEFGNDYFYTLGLNLKFCSGIRNFMKNETLKSQYSKPISKIFQHWQKQNCSKSGKANSELEINWEIGFFPCTEKSD